MKVVVDDIAVEYQSEGNGPVLLLLHGWKDSLHTFDALVPKLSDSYRVVRLDLPGFGQSDMPKPAWDLEKYARFVKGFCEKIQIVPEVVAGHSFGGRVAIKGVGEGILKPRKVILISSAGIARTKSFKNHVLRVIARVGKFATALPGMSAWRHQLRRALYKKIGSDYFASGALKDTYLNIVREDLQETASRISLPTLIIWGKDDTSTPLSYAERFHALIPGSKLCILEGGHFVHREHPGEVAGHMLSFI